MYLSVTITKNYPYIGDDGKVLVYGRGVKFSSYADLAPQFSLIAREFLPTTLADLDGYELYPQAITFNVKVLSAAQNVNEPLMFANVTFGHDTWAYTRRSDKGLVKTCCRVLHDLSINNCFYNGKHRKKAIFDD